MKANLYIVVVVHIVGLSTGTLCNVLVSLHRVYCGGKQIVALCVHIRISKCSYSAVNMKDSFKIIDP